MTTILNPSAAGDQSGVGSAAIANPLNLALAPLRIAELLDRMTTRAAKIADPVRPGDGGSGP
jgi:hypothetical protein